MHAPARRANPRGFQVTFFRVRTGIGEDNPSAFAPTQVLFAHAALADPTHGKLRHCAAAARAGFDLAYARKGQRRRANSTIGLCARHRRGHYAAKVTGQDFAFDVEFAGDAADLLQGERGFSRKGPDPRAASHYYSQPQLAVTGDVVGRRTGNSA